MKRTTPFTADDCIRTMYQRNPDGDTNEDLVAIIKLNSLTEEYRSPDYQLFRLSGGFGCTPTSSGNACYGRFCVDGEETRWQRQNFIGIANAEVTKYAEELESVWDGGGGQPAATRERENEPEMEM